MNFAFFSTSFFLDILKKKKKRIRFISLFFFASIFTVTLSFKSLHPGILWFNLSSLHSYSGVSWRSFDYLRFVWTMNSFILYLFFWYPFLLNMKSTYFTSVYQYVSIKSDYKHSWIDLKATCNHLSFIYPS